MYKTIRKHLEGSLERLQTEYVDIYYLHRMSGVPVEKVAEAMGRLMEEGLIRGWGLSQVDVDIIDRAQKVTPLAIPGSKNKERIIENLDSWDVDLTDEEFAALEDALSGLKVYGHRWLGGF